MELEYDCVDRDKQGLAKELDERIGQYSALAHAAMAKVAETAAEFDQIGGWGAPGIRNLIHWAAINLGFDPNTAKELLRVGQSLASLPVIAEAFRLGSFRSTKSDRSRPSPRRLPKRCC